jgi:hypothetical protein
VSLDQGGSFGGFIGGEHFRELNAREGVEAGLGFGDAVEPPLGIGETLDEFGFAFAGRVPSLEEAVEVLLVEGCVVAGKEDGAASEPGFDGVQRSFWLWPRRILGRCSGARFGGSRRVGLLRFPSVVGRARRTPRYGVFLSELASGLCVRWLGGLSVGSWWAFLLWPG